MDGTANQNGRQRVSVNVGVIYEHTGRTNRQRSVFIDRPCVVERNRRVVYGRDSDRDGGRGGSALAIADRIGKCVATEVVGGWHIGNCAVGVDRRRAVRWSAGAGN